MPLVQELASYIRELISSGHQPQANRFKLKRIMPAERNLRIGNCSGATGDAPHAMARMVREADVDVVTGDW